MSSSTELPPQAVERLAEDLIGPLLIGTMLNVCLYGALLMQTNSLWLKLAVCALLIVDTVNSFAASFVAYDFAVRDFGNVPKILTTTPAFAIIVITTAISGSIVQAFFGIRVKWLTKHTWLGAFIITSAILQFLCGVAVITAGTVVQKFQRFHEFSAVVIVWLVLAPVTDMVITGSLVAFLRSHRTGFTTTDNILSKLARLTIQTGLITVIWAVIDLVLFLVMNTNVHFIFNISLAKLYANCMLSSLNARAHWSAQSVPHPQQWSTTERNGVKVTTTTGVHTDIELDQRPNRYRNATPDPFPKNHVIDITREPSNPPPRGHKPDSNGDGLSLTSESDLETEGEMKSHAVDQRVDWRGML